ncbi:unnamed protein product, partial [Prorocentrum cordatum]
MLHGGPEESRIGFQKGREPAGARRHDGPSPSGTQPGASACGPCSVFRSVPSESRRCAAPPCGGVAVAAAAAGRGGDYPARLARRQRLGRAALRLLLAAGLGPGVARRSRPAKRSGTPWLGGARHAPPGRGAEMAEAKKAKTGQEAYYKVIDGNKYDRALLENAEEFAADGQIGYPEAKQLWQDAQDGKGVTDIERATLEYALKTYKFTPKAKNFLTTYLAAGQSKSYYKVVDGVRYDRELLESAEKAAADGQVSLPEAKELLASAADGKGVTETEKATLSFALKKLKFTDKARQFMEDSLRDVKTVTPRHRPPRAEEAEEQLPRSKEEARRARADVAQRTDCPYLGTINRHVLDFDFEKLCCVSLSGENVYVDLVDGKYFQGRGKETHAYRHALEKGHYVWMNVVDGKVFCIPDGYEVVDKSLEDIKFNLHPLFDEEEILQTSTKVRYAKALDGTDYIPGCIGLNNICSSDYQNVVVQCLCQVIPLRNMLLGYLAPKEKKADPVLSSLADLMRKMYNPRNFKGLVSPHEFYQAIGRATGKKFYAKQQ